MFYRLLQKRGRREEEGGLGGGGLSGGGLSGGGLSGSITLTMFV